MMSYRCPRWFAGVHVLLNWQIGWCRDSYYFGMLVSGNEQVSYEKQQPSDRGTSTDAVLSLWRVLVLLRAITCFEKSEELSAISNVPEIHRLILNGK
ncbi:MAG: hypothetical protein ACLR88_03635 [[Clostridium] innocuum]